MPCFTLVTSRSCIDYQGDKKIRVDQCCRGCEWSFKNSESRKILVEFCRFRSLVFSAVMCVSKSRFLYEVVSESRFFARLRVSHSKLFEVLVSQSKKSKCNRARKEKPLSRRLAFTILHP